MNANELYFIVKPAIIVGICGQTELVTSFIEHAIASNSHCNITNFKLVFPVYNEIYFIIAPHGFGPKGPKQS